MSDFGYYYPAASYGPGNMNDPGVNYAWEPYVGGGGSGVNWGQVTNGLFGLANTWMQTDAAMKMQRAQDGRLYMEGQPTVMRESSLQIPTSLIIIGGLVAVVMLAKD